MTLYLVYLFALLFDRSLSAVPKFSNSSARRRGYQRLASRRGWGQSIIVRSTQIFVSREPSCDYYYYYIIIIIIIIMLFTENIPNAFKTHEETAFMSARLTSSVTVL